MKNLNNFQYVTLNILKLPYFGSLAHYCIAERDLSGYTEKQLNQPKIIQGFFWKYV